MHEFTIDSYRFRVKKMSAMKQMHLVRRVSPLVPPLVPVFMSIATTAQNDEKTGQKRGSGEILLSSPDFFAELLTPVCDAISTMTDEDSEKLFDLCMTHVEYETTPGQFVPVWNSNAKAILFPDIINGLMLIRLSVEVAKDQLGPFITGLLTGPTEPSNQTA